MGGAAERHADLDRPLKQRMQPRPAMEDHVAGEFDLGDRPLVLELARGPFAGAEPRRQTGGPVAGGLLQNPLVEAVGDRGQPVGVCAGDDLVVLHAEPDAGASQLLRDVGMSVQETVHGEREIRSDTQAHRAHDRMCVDPLPAFRVISDSDRRTTHTCWFEPDRATSTTSRS